MYMTNRNVCCVINPTVCAYITHPNVSFECWFSFYFIFFSNAISLCANILCDTYAVVGMLFSFLSLPGCLNRWFYELFVEAGKHKSIESFFGAKCVQWWRWREFSESKWPDQSSHDIFSNCFTHIYPPPNEWISIVLFSHQFDLIHTFRCISFSDFMLIETKSRRIDILPKDSNASVVVCDCLFHIVCLWMGCPKIFHAKFWLLQLHWISFFSFSYASIILLFSFCFFLFVHSIFIAIKMGSKPPAKP